MTKLVALGFLALVLGTGCALVGFDPIDVDPGEAGSASLSGGIGGPGGSGGTQASGGTGLSGSGGSGGGASSAAGGVGGAGGMGGGDADASIDPPDAGEMPVPDAGPPTACTGKPNGSACDDGAFCTVGDLCSGGECLPGLPMECGGDACNESICNELLDFCTTVPVADNTSCGVLGAVCIDGLCSATVFDCGDGGDCQPLCQSSTCSFGCENASSCETTCRDGATCTTNCTGADTCELDCDQDSICYFNCMLTGTCSGSCTGESRCAVQCTDASGCGDFECLENSECKIQCAEGESCGFAECWDEPQECGPGVVICGSDCSDW